jgi:hypothetical protein
MRVFGPGGCIIHIRVIDTSNYLYFEISIALKHTMKNAQISSMSVIVVALASHRV